MLKNILTIRLWLAEEDGAGPRMIRRIVLHGKIWEQKYQNQDRTWSCCERLQQQNLGQQKVLFSGAVTPGWMSGHNTLKPSKRACDRLKSFFKLISVWEGKKKSSSITVSYLTSVQNKNTWKPREHTGNVHTSESGSAGHVESNKHLKITVVSKSVSANHSIIYSSIRV